MLLHWNYVLLDEHSLSSSSKSSIVKMESVMKQGSTNDLVILRLAISLTSTLSRLLLPTCPVGHLYLRRKLEATEGLITILSRRVDVLILPTSKYVWKNEKSMINQLYWSAFNFGTRLKQKYCPNCRMMTDEYHSHAVR